MKKLMSLMLVLVMVSAASAVMVRVDPADAKASYEPSDVITIQLVTEVGELNVTGLTIDAITDFGAGGVAQSQAFASGFEVQQPGALMSGGVLVEYMFCSDTTLPSTGISGVLYSIEYHVPEVAASTIIEIGTIFDNDLYLAPWIDYVGGDFVEGNLVPVQIHVTPEPMTIALLGLGGLLLRKRS